MLTNIIEALIFAAADGVTYNNIKEAFGKEYTEKEIKSSIAELKEKCSGENGIILIEYNSTYQFQTNPKYSDRLADILRPIKERQLSTTVLQTLAIIAYRQPVTRAEIEEIRGGISSDYAIGVLMRAELIEIKARKETIGRPALYGTTDAFLKRFQLTTLDALPDYTQLIESIKSSGKFNATGDNIYEIKNKELSKADNVDEFFEELNDDKPDFLKYDDVVVVDSDATANS
jgi:segregation and condensation protein B